MVPAFTGLGAPHWRPDARGLITGLTLDDGRDEIVAATLKSVGFQTADLIRAVEDDGVATGALRVDGGMVVNDWFCQFLADVTGVPIERPEVTETTAYGAALLAALGAGLFSDLTAASAAWRPEARFAANVSPAQREEWLVGWRRAVRRALA